jgi:hypothetical protein
MVRKLLVPLLGAVLLGTVGSAQSAPFELTDDSGFPGDPVTLSLLDDSTNGYEAALLLLTFDPTQLDFLDAPAGPLSDGFSVFSGEQAPGEWLISLAAAAAPSTGEQGSIVELLLRIRDDAALGDTQVSLVCAPGFCPPDYDVPLTTGTVSVLASTVPEPSSLALMLLAAVAIGATRRHHST